MECWDVEPMILIQSPHPTHSGQLWILLLFNFVESTYTQRDPISKFWNNLVWLGDLWVPCSCRILDSLMEMVLHNRWTQQDFYLKQLMKYGLSIHSWGQGKSRVVYQGNEVSEKGNSFCDTIFFYGIILSLIRSTHFDDHSLLPIGSQILF